MHLGARSLKTGIAVTIALMIADLFQLTPPIMAGVAAAATTLPSVRRSFRAMINNIYGNLIGAVIAILFMILIGDHPISVGLAVVTVIAIHLKFSLNNTLTLTMITVIFIMSSGMDNQIAFILEAFRRFVLICIGVGSATLINILLLPPKYEDSLYKSILGQTGGLFKWVRLLSAGTSDNTKIKSERTAFDREKLKIEDYYHWYKEERVYSRKIRLVKFRRCVLFREMIRTTGRLHRMLDLLDRQENAWRKLPADFRQMFKAHLDALMDYHERILLMYDGKIRRKRHEEQAKSSGQDKSGVVSAFARHCADPVDGVWIDVLPLISALTEYSQHVEHLDSLVNSFQTWHRKENRIRINGRPG
jgi:uncharacterized membrane protein YgaE (UPF0421/DUF939 family)